MEQEKQMIQVNKRNGTKEALDIEKLHKVVFHACEDITGVSPSEVEIKSQIQFYNGMTSKEIQETLIKAAADLISEVTPNYQYVGGRLINYSLRKEVYGRYTPCPVKELVDRNTANGFYDEELVTKYDDEEWAKIATFIKHERDENLTYVAMEQLRGKYLVQNRVSGDIFETPQMCYILIAVQILI
jgi:ribonucleoside-diphosphate reductase alpha chain